MMGEEEEEELAKEGGEAEQRRTITAEKGSWAGALCAEAS